MPTAGYKDEQPEEGEAGGTYDQPIELDGWDP